ncbi:putative MFS family arabinose efflux permease [Saccharothrix saharensis]|uniref:Putative MFS family arabinose efflux permease n=1 Tax=Saccharothrix saharensis TaxID=571190 RepID=A0A543JNR2_9PSEU|nr:MFS transporter [Saccharothrix saharensis]TQM84428.1 putative MFS family arabinose efflux permease [Saccharothrix saharensis]
MLSVPSNRAYRRVFTAQVVALVGTGLATVALGLLAYDLAGPDAGAVLGTALAIKMVAYVGVAPIAGALTARVPRRALLVTLDLVRATIAAALPWVDAIWQVHLLIFLLHAASAAFTPAFQATIPEILTDERDYTRALSLSRLAYDLESLLSPLVAAAVLVVLGHDDLFLGTAAGFVGSALLVLSAALPATRGPRRDDRPFTATVRGIRIHLATPRLRGLLAVHLAVAAAGSMVLVNTVGYVRDLLGRDDTAVAVALAANGLGSLVAAFTLPAVLDRFTDRAVMLRACAGLAAVLLLAVPVTALLGDSRWPALLALWALIGAGSSLVLTPGGRLLRRSAHPADLPAVFAADFALSHACWLLGYPLAGGLATAAGMPVALAVLAAVTVAATVLAARFWPTRDPEVIEHEHDLDHDHHHLADAALVDGRWRHVHHYRIDDLHHRWPA